METFRPATGVNKSPEEAELKSLVRAADNALISGNKRVGIQAIKAIFELFNRGSTQITQPVEK